MPGAPRPTPTTSVGTMSGGASAGGDGGGSVGDAGASRPMVSVEDPPLSPSQFTRPGQKAGQKPPRV